MSDSTPITEHLRDLVKSAPLTLALTLFVECDNIDAIHKKLEDDHAALERECAEMRDFCERVKGAVMDGDDVTLFGVDYTTLPADDDEVTLFGVDYTALPLDADGVPIHVGDVMEYPNGGREEVRFMTLNGAGWLVNEAGWLPVQIHHHQAPTVEDVLREFLGACENSMMLGYPEVPQELFDNFTKRLQLAEGDAE